MEKGNVCPILKHCTQFFDFTDIKYFIVDIPTQICRSMPELKTVLSASFILYYAESRGPWQRGETKGAYREILSHELRSEQRTWSDDLVWSGLGCLLSLAGPSPRRSTIRPLCYFTFRLVTNTKS